MACYVVPARTQPLTPDPLEPEQIITGDPQVGTHEILQTENVDIGIWEHTAGVSTDIEADEVFVVLAGRASIAVAGEDTLEVGPGDVGVLEAGAQTKWTVHETLRKIYILR